MPLSSILCSWIQLTERNKTWKFEENRLRKLNDTQSSKTMVSSSLLPSSRLISSSKTMILRAEYHYSFEIENLYHLLYAFSLDFLTNALRKSLSFTMCFFILLLDFLWKHAWAQLALTEETPIIYYVLSHSISRFSLKTRMGSTRSYWGNPYHLLCASPFYSPADALRKPLSFTMCFLIGFILFPGGRIAIGETSII